MPNYGFSSSSDAEQDTYENLETSPDNHENYEAVENKVPKSTQKTRKKTSWSKKKKIFNEDDDVDHDVDHDFNVEKNDEVDQDLDLQKSQKPRAQKVWSLDKDDSDEDTDTSTATADEEKAKVQSEYLHRIALAVGVPFAVIVLLIIIIPHIPYGPGCRYCTASDLKPEVLVEKEGNKGNNDEMSRKAAAFDKILNAINVNEMKYTLNNFE